MITCAMQMSNVNVCTYSSHAYGFSSGLPGNSFTVASSGDGLHQACPCQVMEGHAGLEMLKCHQGPKKAAYLTIYIRLNLAEFG